MNPDLPMFARAIFLFSFLLIALSVVTGICSAQQRADPQATGQGNATAATTRGFSALYSNVGAMALDPLESGFADDDVSQPRVQIDAALFPFGAAAGSTYLSPGDLNFVFGNKDCGVFSDQDKQRLARLLEDDRLSADVAMDLIGARFRLRDVGALGIRFGQRVRASVAFPENFRQNVLMQGDVFSRDQIFAGSEVGGEWIQEMEISLASSWRRSDIHPDSAAWFPVVGFGLGAASLTGIVHFDVDPASRVNTHVIPGVAESDERSVNVTGYYAFRSSAPENFEPAQAILTPGFGTADTVSAGGWGFRFGISGVLYRRRMAPKSALVNDPLTPSPHASRESWVRDAVMFGISLEEIGSLVWDGTNLQRVRDIDTVVTDGGNGVTYEMLCNYQGEKDTIGAFRTQLPARLRIGVAGNAALFFPEITGDLYAELEASIDLNDAVGRQGTRVSLGAFWRSNRWLTLRGGLTVGGNTGAALALGAGVTPFPWLSLDIGTSEATALLTNDPSRYDFAFRMTGHLGL